MYIYYLCLYICQSVCVFVDGLARDRGGFGADTPGLPRSCAEPWARMFDVYMCVCVLVHLYLHDFIHSRTIAHEANVICCTCTRL